jgi:prevent-host-death family protein
MKTLEMAKAKAPLSEYAKNVRKEPLVLTVDGKPVAALVPIENADLETVALSTNPRFLALIERSRHKSEGGIFGTEMRRRLGVKQGK